MESVAEEILREILLKLPTRDFARCGSACKLWRDILRDPSFRRLHANAVHVTSGAGVEALLLSHRKQQGMTSETTVFSVSSTKFMCCVTDLADQYHLANVCNGFILLASDRKKDPLFVCNPITGEKFKVPASPFLKAAYRHLFAMGYSPSTDKYKVFRIPFQEFPVEDNYLDVYNFDGSDRGWRRHPDHFFTQIANTNLLGMNLSGGGVRWTQTPVLVDGKLYVTMNKRENDWISQNIVVIDVESEANCTYYLPAYQANNNINNIKAIDIFELGRQPCMAMHFHDKLCVYLMPSSQLVHGGQQLEKKLSCDWTQRYIFIISSFEYEPRGIWVDDDGILCYLTGDQMYKYDTTKNSKHMEKVEHNVGFLAWDQILCLPSWTSIDNGRHSIYSGYRPTLLSPRDLAGGQQDNDVEVLQHTWLRALKCYKSNKDHRSPCVENGGSDLHSAKSRTRR